MEANAGMVAGSHKRNEFVMIRHEGEPGVDQFSHIYSLMFFVPYLPLIMQPKLLKNFNGQECQICGDTVGLSATGDLFVACNECAFPVCRACYEYERKEGNKSCPQCKTRYKRHKGIMVLIILLLIVAYSCVRIN
ncbi:hypothetical protein B296_00035468 [Ensete ventricosum]|uniref:RING-type domain-containing protein n=1 Tax=Ensete ventricosum TaxID=4639 RepID=A0A426Y9N3_ENSVE|nr:hypothetical protein B296_00035468 [Ensete ventricosum]